LQQLQYVTAKLTHA